MRIVIITSVLLAVGLAAAASMEAMSSSHAAGSARGPVVLSAADVHTLPPSSPPTVVGVSRLLRTSKGIGFDIETTGLVPGDPHSFWVFIDESPATLPGPPGLEDFEIRLTVNGGFASPSGTQRFSGFLPAGALPPPNGASVLAVDDGFFDNPLNARISLAVRAHGAPIQGQEYEQTNFLMGGCPPNNCATIQAALHAGGAFGNGVPGGGRRGNGAGNGGGSGN